MGKTHIRLRPRFVARGLRHREAVKLTAAEASFPNFWLLLQSSNFILDHESVSSSPRLALSCLRKCLPDARVRITRVCACQSRIRRDAFPGRKRLVARAPTDVGGSRPVPGRRGQEERLSFGSLELGRTRGPRGSSLLTPGPGARWAPWARESAPCHERHTCVPRSPYLCPRGEPGLIPVASGGRG